MDDRVSADEVRLWRYELPLDAPVSLRRGETLTVREGVIVEVVRDGESHLGEAAPLPGFSRETLHEAEEQLRHLIFAYPDLDLSTGSAFRGNLLPSVDFAVWSVFYSMKEEPWTTVPLCGLINGGEPDEMVADAAGLAGAGYRTLKVKVGRGEVGEDAGLVGRIAAATGDGVGLRLDANRGWSMPEAVEFSSRVEAFARRIEFVEEPLADADAGSLGMLRQETGLPIALDESLVGVEPGILDGGRYSFVRAVVLKPQLVGAARSLGFARRAPLFGAGVVVSASYESGAGMLGLLRFARECATDEFLAAGLDTYRRLREDVFEERLDLSGPAFERRDFSPPKLRYDRLERLL